MSEEAIRAELAALGEKMDNYAAEMRRTVESNKDSHKDIYDRLNLLEKICARMVSTSTPVRA